MPPLTRLLLASVAGALVALTGVTVSAAAEPCGACLRAGAATVPMTPPPGTPLAGYGSTRRRLLFPDVLGRHPHAFWFKPSEGELDPLAVRALVLETEAARLVWVAVDLVAVNREFTRGVEARLRAAGVPPASLMVSASHTHSGPGAFGHSGLWALFAADRFDADVESALLAAVTEAVRRAEAAKTPARVTSFSVTAPPVTEGRLDLPVDREIVGLRVARRDGGDIALVWNFAIHGTTLSASNLRLSGDVMGVASRTLERELGVPALYVNGAVADVRPNRHGLEAALEVGMSLAETVRGGWASSQPPRDASLAVGEARVVLGSPTLSASNCLRGWMPSAISVPVGAALPDDAVLVGAALGDTAWVTMPGELQSGLGEEIKAAARPRFARAFVAGLSNDYLGYFVSAEAYARPAYVSCATLYGARAGARLTSAAVGLLRSLGGGAGAAFVPGRGRAGAR